MHPELWAAVTMLLPSVIAASFVQRFPSFSEIRVSALGCVLHCPWSCMLHTYRALGTNHRMRTILYKLDVTFIHVHGLCQGYAWRGRHSTFDSVLHGLSMAYMWKADPLRDPSVKMVINVLVAVAVLQSTFGLMRRNFSYWCISLAIWAVAFWIHCFKPLGPLSNAYFHALLALPEWLLLRGIMLHKRAALKKTAHDDEDEDDEDDDETDFPFIDMDVEGLLEEVMVDLQPLAEEPRKGLRFRFQGVRRFLSLRKALGASNVGLESL